MVGELLAAGAAVAGILGNATNIIDKIYTRFYEKKTGEKPQVSFLQVEHSQLIGNDPSKGALVATDHGVEVQSVTYQQLGQRLSQEDMRYINARENVMNQLYEQWEAGHAALPTEMDPIRKKQLEQRLDQTTDSLAYELSRILKFITKAGLFLDDHYLKFKDLAGVPD